MILITQSMVFDTTTNQIHLNGILLTMTIELSMSILDMTTNMTLCHTMTFCPISMTTRHTTNKQTLIENRQVIRFTIDNISIKRCKSMIYLKQINKDIDNKTMSTNKRL